MSDVTWHDPYLNQSLFKRVATPILRGLHGVLPEPVYEALYGPAFALYQWRVRETYARSISTARRQGDARQVMKMERVYRVMKHSLVGASGLEHTHDLAQAVIDQGVPGAFVECGVAQGGCAALLAQVAAGDSERHCWFFDSYEGLPEPTVADYQDGRTGQHIRPLPKGSCLGTIEQVSELLFDEMGAHRDRVHLIKGWFQDTLPVERGTIGPIALLRADGDWYESTKCVLENLYDAVSSGGHVIIDDYCSCFGARRATDEFLARRGIDTKLVPDGRGGASFEKPQQLSPEIQVA